MRDGKAILFCTTEYCTDDEEDVQDDEDEEEEVFILAAAAAAAAAVAELKKVHVLNHNTLICNKI